MCGWERGSNIHSTFLHGNLLKTQFSFFVHFVKRVFKRLFDSIQIQYHALIDS